MSCLCVIGSNKPGRILYQYFQGGKLHTWMVLPSSCYTGAMTMLYQWGKNGTKLRQKKQNWDKKEQNWDKEENCRHWAIYMYNKHIYTCTINTL